MTNKTIANLRLQAQVYPLHMADLCDMKQRKTYTYKTKIGIRPQPPPRNKSICSAKRLSLSALPIKYPRGTRGLPIRWDRLLAQTASSPYISVRKPSLWISSTPAILRSMCYDVLTSYSIRITKSGSTVAYVITDNPLLTLFSSRYPWTPSCRPLSHVAITIDTFS